MSEHLRSASKAVVRPARRHGGELRRVRQKAPPLEGGVSHSPAVGILLRRGRTAPSPPRHGRHVGWLRDSGPTITDIIALPLDIFPGVQFHMELVMFNLPNIEHHRFLPQKYLNQMLQQDVIVNIKTRRYHLSGNKQAQRLKDAVVMTEAAAIEAGFRYARER